MRLTLKLVFCVVALIMLILCIDAYLSVQRESDFLRKELEQKSYRIGHAMKQLVADAWRHEGQERVMALIRAANQREEYLLIRWVWLDEAKDDRFSPQAPRDHLGKVSIGDSVTLRYLTSKGNPILLTYVTVSVDQRQGALELSEPLSTIDDFVRTSLYRKIVLAAIVATGSLAVTLLLGIWLVGWPLKQLTDKADRAGAGDLSDPIVLHGHDELSNLAVALNQMCERLAESQQRVRHEADARIATIEQLRHADRLRTVGQLASGVAHELGTPLNVVSGRATLISSGRLSPDAVTESAGIIKSQAERMAGIIRQLLDFSRSGSAHRVQVDLLMIARQTAQILEPLSRKHGVSLSVTESSTPVLACVDTGQIQQVLTNLVVNAIQATPSGGKVTIDVTDEHCQPPRAEGPAQDHYLCLSVTDTGQGISESVRERLFEPFVTTKDVGEGTGLGLSIAYGIVRDHGGWIDVQSEPGWGSRFRVYLPEGKESCRDES